MSAQNEHLQRLLCGGPARRVHKVRTPPAPVPAERGRCPVLEVLVLEAACR